MSKKSSTSSGNTSSGSTSNSQSASIPSGVYSITMSTNSNYALDISSASTASGANLQIYASNGTGAQKFCIESKDGYCTIKNVNSNMMLDVYAAGMNAGTN